MHQPETEGDSTDSSFIVHCINLWRLHLFARFCGWQLDSCDSWPLMLPLPMWGWGPKKTPKLTYVHEHRFIHPWVEYPHKNPQKMGLGHGLGAARGPPARVPTLVVSHDHWLICNIRLKSELETEIRIFLLTTQTILVC